MQVAATGIPWYRRADWSWIVAVMDDADRLPASYDAWLAKAEQVIQNVEREGGIAVKAHLDPDAFPAWCRERGLNVDARARMQYASWVAAEAHRHGGR